MKGIKSIITGNPDFKKSIPDVPYLQVSEFFCDTIQGEGIEIGHPATFLRMQHCTLNCHWCDTQEVWRYGNPYSFGELFNLMDEFDVPRKLYEGQHLVLTGGSPLQQQDRLIMFLELFIKEYDFKPYVEVENECTIEPLPPLVKLVDCWNNSPKLRNSGNLDIVRYQPRILSYLSTLSNSWFKFVITNQDDWDEIRRDFIEKKLIKKDQIILMPQGASRQELETNRESVIQLAVENNVRYCTREHVILWDKATGV